MKLRLVFHTASAGFCCLIASGCSGGGAGSPAAPSLPIGASSASASGGAKSQTVGQPVVASIQDLAAATDLEDDVLAKGGGGHPKRLFVAAGTAGIQVYTTKGKLLSTYATATTANWLAMDDAGNAYVVGSGSPNPLVRYGLNQANPSATYNWTPQGPSNFVLYAEASHSGELVALVFVSQGHGVFSNVYNVWDPGVVGAPSRTFTYANNGVYNFAVSFAIAPDGTLYIPYFDTTTQTQRYDVFLPGASTPSRTIVDSIVSGPSAQTFDANWMTVARDGTLYVGEWSFHVGDPLAGLYVYPKSGAETLITNGVVAPTVIALDASGKVYVLNSNTGMNFHGQWVCDTAHTLSVYSKNGGPLLSQATSGFENGVPLTVGPAGNAYISEYGYQSPLIAGCTDSQGLGAIAKVLAGSSSGATIVGNLTIANVVIYDGKTATNSGMQAR